MADNYSSLEKLCLNTIKSGAINAFTDMFRLTHLQEPLSENEPQTYEDIIATSGADAPALIPEFAFDNPLSFPLKKLMQLEALLEEADNSGLSQDLLQKFNSLSQISDLFLHNNKLRCEVKMSPLVMPYAVYEDLVTSKSSDVLSLIDSQEFTRTIEAESALMQAIAAVKGQQLRQQLFIPVVVNYALLARNTLFEYCLRELKGRKSTFLLNLICGTATAENDLSQIEELKFTLLLTACFLRLAYALNEFALYKAAYLTFEKFNHCVTHLEQLLDGKFTQVFLPTSDNIYKELLSDDHINNDKAKKDDNLAFASLEMTQIPRIFYTLIEKEDICSDFNIDLGEIALVAHNSMREQDLLKLAEFIYCGRLFCALNMIELGCKIFNSQTSGNIEFAKKNEIDLKIRGFESNNDKLSVEQLEEPQLPSELLCNYQQLLETLALFDEATEFSFNNELFCLEIPSFKRLCELSAQLNKEELCQRYIDIMMEKGQIFRINALAWRARFARQRGDEGTRLLVLRERYDAANLLVSETQDAISGFEKQENELAVKYAVSAASELTFSCKDNENLMEEAWKSLEGQSNEMADNTIIEARVRYGAVKGKETVERIIQSECGNEIEEGHDEDLDECLLSGGIADGEANDGETIK